MTVRRQGRCAFQYSHLMGLVRRSVPKLLTSSLLTDELFRADASRDYPPIRVKNDRVPRSREMLLGEHVLENAVRHPDDHRVEPSSAFVLNGYVNQHHPAVFNASEIALPRFTQSQSACSSYSSGFGSRWFTCVDVLLVAIRRLDDDKVAA